jgi:hypothetical protein
MMDDAPQRSPAAAGPRPGQAALEPARARTMPVTNLNESVTRDSDLESGAARAASLRTHSRGRGRGSRLTGH